MTAARRPFYKLSGSGNDFVFFDLRDGPADDFATPHAVRSICARGTGVGADGVVFLEPESDDSFTIRYFNSDGSLGELCGNATLCALRLAHKTGIISGESAMIHTDAGDVAARLVDGLPEIDLAPVTEVIPAASNIDRLKREKQLGFARAGVPHLVILDDDVSGADVLRRGSELRRHRSLKDGANVNFLSPSDDSWLIRTYERGVEGETLACGTGAVAAGILLLEWKEAKSPVRLITRSGRTLEVRARKEGSAWLPSLRGAADIVFAGELRELPL